MTDGSDATESLAISSPDILVTYGLVVYGGRQSA